MIDAGEGFPRNRILAFEGDTGGERAGAIEQRLRRADRAGTEPDAGAGLHLPIGAERGRLPGRNFRRQRDASQARIDAGEAIVEAEPQDVGGEIADMGKRLRRGAGGQIARYRGVAELHVEILGLDAQSVRQRRFAAAADHVAGFGGVKLS